MVRTMQRRVNAAKSRKNNPEKTAVYLAEYAKKNPEKGKANKIRWQKKYPERYLGMASAQASKRRDLKLHNTPIDEMLTSTEWLAILREAKGHCYYCDKEAKLTLDHVIPLSRGGRHNKGNVAAACAHCNSSKGARTLEEWTFYREEGKL